MNILNFIRENPKIGNTTSRDDLLDFLKKTECRDYQLLLHGRFGNGKSPSPDFTKSVRESIQKGKHRVFNHCAYTINLSDLPPDMKNVKSLLNEWKDSLTLNFSGAVVHVGKACKRSTEEGIKNMTENVVLTERSLTMMMCEGESISTCPLLIETPAGQGTEVCWKLEDFSDFYKKLLPRITNPQHVKICVDTCHVFASGYDPLEYLVSWESLHPGTIGLIHYNGSKTAKGSRVDRHDFLASQIDLSIMKDIFTWGLSRNIPMIIE